jgi:hypothetical protein
MVSEPVLRQLRDRIDVLCRRVVRDYPGLRDEMDLLRVRLYQNVEDSVRFGDTGDRQAERNEILYLIGQLSPAGHLADVINLTQPTDEAFLRESVTDLLVYLGSSNVSWPDGQGLVLFTRSDPPFNENEYAAALCLDEGNLNEAIVRVLPYIERKRVIISQHTLMQAAVSRLSEAGLGYFNMDSLEVSLGKFDEYREYVNSFSLESRINERMTPSSYIPLRLDVRDGTPLPQAAEEYVKNWIAADNRRLLCLFGDYGSGKTSLCERIVTSLFGQAGRPARMPVLIRLGEFAGTFQLESIVATWCSRFRTGLTFDAFQHMCRSGRFVVMADGLDELQTGVTERELVRNLAELLRLAEDDGKLILTSRTTYFQRYIQQTGVFEAAIAKSRMRSTMRSDSTEISFASVKPFARRDISLLATATLGASTADSWLRTLRRHPQVARLASTPLLLVLLLREWARPDARVEGTASVLAQYTQSWLRRDSLEYDLLLREQDREEFSCALAFRMLLNGENRISYADLSDLVVEIYGLRVSQPRQLDYFDSELRTCTFLTRDPDGYFRFIHRIFQEFFAAQSVAHNLTRRGSSELRPETGITTETWRLLHELLSESWNVRAAQAVVTGTADTVGSSVDRLGRGLALAYLGARAEISEFNRIDNVIVHEASFIDLVLNNVQIYKADLSDCDFSRSNFSRFNLREVLAHLGGFRRTKWESGMIEDSDLLNAHFDQSILSDVTIRSTRLGRASMLNSELRRCLIENCDLSGLALRDSRLTDVTFRNVNLRGADLRGIDLASVSIDDDSLNGAILE